MKKLFIPLFLSSMVILGITTMYVSGAYYLAKHPDYSEKGIVRDLTISEVRQTNVKIEPNVDYTAVYKVRKYTYAKNLIVKYQLDTVGVLIVATGKDETVPKPQLPKDFSWGNLKL